MSTEKGFKRILTLNSVYGMCCYDYNDRKEQRMDIRNTDTVRNRMSADEIANLVVRLIGSLEPIGDTAVDNKVIQNIRIFGETLFNMCCMLNYITRHADSQYASKKIAGKTAADILIEAAKLCVENLDKVYSWDEQESIVVDLASRLCGNKVSVEIW